eukprot:13580386-Alexandrium_andersonii.AAC.1
MALPLLWIHGLMVTVGETPRLLSLQPWRVSVIASLAHKSAASLHGLTRTLARGQVLRRQHG